MHFFNDGTNQQILKQMDLQLIVQAASAGHTDIVRLLIAHGADVNAQSRYVYASNNETEVGLNACPFSAPETPP